MATLWRVQIILKVRMPSSNTYYIIFNSYAFFFFLLLFLFLFSSTTTTYFLLRLVHNALWVSALQRVLTRKRATRRAPTLLLLL